MAAPPGGDDLNKSPLIQILTWFLFLVGVFSLCARFGSKLFMSVRISGDDWLALAAQGVLLFQAVTLSVGANNGLGKPLDSLSENEMRIALQAEYAYIPLLLLALALIKWSLCVYIGQLTHIRRHRWMNKGAAFVVGLWLATAVLVGLFQCRLPAPWDVLETGKCINRKAWWTYVTVVNIATEFGFVAIYLSIFHGLQTSTMRKVSVLTVFSARLLVAVAAAAQLATFVRDAPTDEGRGGYNGWTPIVCNQLVACLSTVTACAPYLRPFMQSIELGVVQVNDDGSQEELSQRQTTAPRSHRHHHAQGGSGDTSGTTSGSRSRHRGKRNAGGGGGSSVLLSQLSQISHPAAVRLSSSPEPERG